MKRHDDCAVKCNFWRIFTAAIIISICSGPAFSQAIPPYAGSRISAENVSVDKKTDLPASAGSYVFEGGFDYYMNKGNFYKDRVDESGNSIADSNGNKYSPWGVKVNPAVEFFLFDMFAFGGLLNFEYEKQGADKKLMLGIGPIVSFYLNKTGRIIPFISVFGAYRHTNFYEAATKSMYWTDQSMSAGGKIGLICMVSRQAGIFVDARYTYGKHQVTVPPLTAQEKKKSHEVESFFGFKYFIY